MKIGYPSMLDALSVALSQDTSSVFFDAGGSHSRTRRASLEGEFGPKMKIGSRIMRIRADRILDASNPTWFEIDAPEIETRPDQEW